MELPATPRRNRAYAGVGCTETPEDICAVMTRLARYLASRGYRVRSGGAPGADTAFELGAPPEAREIYLPWKGFNGYASKLIGPTAAAMAMGATFHPLLAQLGPDDPRWTERKYQTLRKLMGRNVHQVLGPDINDPGEFTACWTPDGVDGVSRPTSGATGGTGQAIRISVAYKVPVFNLADPAVLDRILARLEQEGF